MDQSNDLSVVARDIRKSNIAKGSDRRKDQRSRNITVDALKGVSFATTSCGST